MLIPEHIVCPICKGTLASAEAYCLCTSCQKKYEIKDGVLSFVENDLYYEGKFGLRNVKKSNFYNFFYNLYSFISVSTINYRNKHKKLLNKFKKNKKFNTLDLGCGGGNIDLARSSYVIGVDISRSSILVAKKIYGEVYQSNVINLPFQNNFFDCVFSSDLMGHIAQHDKNEVIDEIYRVLKPNGLTIHYIEISSKKGIDAWAKNNYDLYKKYYIEKEGHYGLEEYSCVINRFIKKGFKLVNYNVMCKLIRPPGYYSFKLNNEYKKNNLLINLLVSLDSILIKNRIIFLISSILLKPFQIITESLYGDDYGSLLYVVFKKKINE